jgi:hypothetical protein
MLNLIRRLRGMTQAGTADYSVAGITWWSDDHLQEVLDLHRVDLNYVPLVSEREYSGGTALYYDYYAPLGNLEETNSGAAYFAIEDSDGDDVADTLYSMDYLRGRVRFHADQGGTAYYIRGRSYNLNSAAADIWRQKMGWRADFVTFRADDQQFNQSDWFKHCAEMAAYFDRQGGASQSTLGRLDLT